MIQIMTTSKTRVFSAITKPPRDSRISHHPLGGGVSGFTALDGEGTGRGSNHRYVLLGVGQDQIENPKGLHFIEIMEFLYAHNKKKQAFTGFFLGYDFTQWFKTLPYDRAAMLLTTQGQALRKHRRPGIPPHPVEYDKWQFDLLATKRLRIRPKLCSCTLASCKCEHAPWMYICDTGGFFQTSLINVIDPRKWQEPIVTDEEFAIILEGKKRRDSAKLDDEMRFYNRLENKVLERVLRQLDLGFRSIHVNLPSSKWFGPGQAAQVWLSGKAPERKTIQETVPSWFLEAARQSYFGGWFEIMMHGNISGKVHEYDINSAYPYIISTLPCLLHGVYTRGIGKPPRTTDKEICLVRARVWTQAYSERRNNQYIGSMLHRDSGGRISRPLMTEGWFWLHELQAAQKAGFITRITNDRYFEWVKYIPCECIPPLREMEHLYLERISVGKDTALGKGAKLVYNSGYGKFAQSVGEPMFGNPVYASLITAGCRTMITNAIATHPKGKSNVAMVATDAVYFLDKHPTLSISERLGEWSYSERASITLFKPGIYWDDATRKQIAQGINPTFKARGINAADFATQLARIDQEFAEWNLSNPDSAQKWPMVTFRPSFSMTTALQALTQNDWSRAGAVTHSKDLKQSCDPRQKRTGVYLSPERGGIYRSEPHWFGIGSGIFTNSRDVTDAKLDVKSYPYQKRFGLDDPWSDESMTENGITPDGYAGEEFRELLQGKAE